MNQSPSSNSASRSQSDGSPVEDSVVAGALAVGSEVIGASVVVTGACVVDDASEVDDNSSPVAIDVEPPPQADAASARAVTTERTNTTGSLTTFLPCGESGGTLPARRRTLKHADSLSTAWGRTQQRSFAPRFAPSPPSPDRKEKVPVDAPTPTALRLATEAADFSEPAAVLVEAVPVVVEGYLFSERSAVTSAWSLPAVMERS